MKPSVFASFITFLISGLFTVTGQNFRTDKYVTIILIATIFCCGIYYYYLNVATENKWGLKRRPPNNEVATWWITACQYLGFFSLWTLLKIDLKWYGTGLFILNCSYLIWDIIFFSHTKKTTESRIVFYLDIAGVVLSVLLLLGILILPPQTISDNDTAHQAIVVTFFCTLISIHAVIGLAFSVFLFKYNPFQLLAMDGEPIMKKANKGEASAEA